MGGIKGWGQHDGRLPNPFLAHITIILMKTDTSQDNLTKCYPYASRAT
jgi:hypothetical protein